MGGGNVKCVLHFSPPEVTALPGYRAWMAAVSAANAEATHVMCCQPHPIRSPALRTAAVQHRQLASIAGAVFPPPPDCPDDDTLPPAGPRSFQHRLSCTKVDMV